MSIIWRARARYRGSDMLNTILSRNKQVVLDDWFSQVANTYPSGGFKFLTEEANQFANPIGSTFRREMEKIFDAFLGDIDTDLVSASLDRINRVRAVQDFSASRAVVFIYILKTVIRKQLKDELTDPAALEDMLALESRIDTLALLAFDSYMRCRERLFEVRLNDIKRQASLAMAGNAQSSIHRSEGDN